MRVINLTTSLIMSLFLPAILCNAASVNTIIYVDDDAAGANDGTSWADAYNYLQEALADANSAEKPVEIRVAQGTYKPNQGLVAIPEFDWRIATFQLINEVTLKGGFAGLGQADPNARDIKLYETILSGDLNDDDIEVADPCDLQDEPTRAENSYHVVNGDLTDMTAVLNGFTITTGNANCPPSVDEHPDKYKFRYGGGMFNDSGSPTVTNCTFWGNSAKWDGGGMYNSYGNPTLTNCTFMANYANNGGGMENFINSSPTLNHCTFSRNSASENGGGIYNEYYTIPVLNHCTFSENSANGNGGGIYNHEKSDAILTDCTLMDNSCENGGGGMWNSMSCPTLQNCIFARNSADFGGGIANIFESSPILSNCTFSNNSAKYEGGGMRAFDNSNSILTNCILWYNTPDQITSSAIVSYSNIQSGFPGEGNIDEDPLFAELGYWADVNDPNIIVEPDDPNALWIEGDYHLKSQAGRWNPLIESWVIDDVTSPCIDTGDPNSDWSGETWPHGERINMGAYGGTRQASMSTRPEAMSLPTVAYIYLYDDQAAESFRTFLVGYGCSTTLIELDQVAATPLDSYDLIIVADDTEFTSTWDDPQTVAAIEESGKPVFGLGEGGYDFFGVLGLWIGNPHGGHGSHNSISVIDPEYSLFSTPYPIDIPDDRILQLYTETNHVGLYLWPVPETVTALGGEVNNPGYYPLAMEHNRYLLWGFTESPEYMTEVGKTLFINVVIWTANAGWAATSL